MRIISLVPSLTRTLFDLGFGDKIVGCTSYCVDPKKETRKITKVGGTKNPQLLLIKELGPTHIFVNTEENRSDDIAQLKAMASTLETFPKDISAVPGMLREIGIFLGLNQNQRIFVDETATKIQEKICFLKSSSALKEHRYLYLIWNDPLMAAGLDTYITSLFSLIGFSNCAPLASRYPVVEIEEINGSQPHYLFLSSEPFPFRKRNALDITQKLKYRPRLVKVDGKLFSWHGTMSLDALEQLENMIANPEWWKPSLMA